MECVVDRQTDGRQNTKHETALQTNIIHMFLPLPAKPKRGDALRIRKRWERGAISHAVNNLLWDLPEISNESIELWAIVTAVSINLLDELK